MVIWGVARPFYRRPHRHLRGRALGACVIPPAPFWLRRALFRSVADAVRSAVCSLRYGAARPSFLG
eukprot:1430899-Pyramimonas_sp.AAC.1